MTAESYSLSRSEWEDLIDQWIFNENHRAIMKRRLLDGVCFEQLAEEFDMSVRGIQNIVYRCSKQLAKHI